MTRSSVVYVALLRGINVGGKNLIRMAALKSCFEAQGLGDVATYIQSGNVLFTAGRASDSLLYRRIEQALSTTFAYDSRIVLRSLAEMREVVGRAPKGFGTRPAVYRYDVIYLKPPLSAGEAAASVPVAEGVDTVAPGPGVLYTTRLISKATRSRIGRVVGTRAYQSMTIRNWNTTVKLLALMEGMGDVSK